MNNNDFLFGSFDIDGKYLIALYPYPNDEMPNIKLNIETKIIYNP